MSNIDYMSVRVDANALKSMGFTDIEINNFLYIYNNGGKFTPAALQSYGYNYAQAKRLAYMFNICCGKVQTNSKEEQIKHLRKMFGSNYRISTQDLAVSSVTSVPRIAVISGIRQKPFNIWNSNNYKGKDALYKVSDVSGKNITIETFKKPKIEYGASMEVPGVLTVKGVKQSGCAVVTINNKYCKLCNRFIIMASLKNPEFHLGKWEMMCFEGTRVYVYAKCMGVQEAVKYKMGNQRVYDYGIFPQDIKAKLDKSAKNMYQYLNCVSAEFSNANSDYKVVPVEKDVFEDTNSVEF